MNIQIKLFFQLQIMFHIVQKEQIFIKSNKLLKLLIIIYCCWIKFPHPSVIILLTIDPISFLLPTPTKVKSIGGVFSLWQTGNFETAELCYLMLFKLNDCTNLFCWCCQIKKDVCVCVCVTITIFIYKNDHITAILWLYSIKSIASYQH